MTSLDPFFAFVFFGLGLVFGSFMNVVIYRVPRGLSVVHPGSACPSCRKPIRPYDNIPVLSWLLLRGRCRGCGTKIAGRYPVVELLTGVLFLACYWQFGLTVAAFKFCIFVFLLLALIFIDAELKLLPDALTLPGLLVGLVLAVWVPVSGFLGRLIPLDTLPFSSAVLFPAASLLNALIGAALGAGVVWGAGKVYFLARGVEGMGFGDVKLMAMIGAFLGPMLTMLVIMVGSLLGSIAGITAMLLVWRKRRARFTRSAPAGANARAWQSAQILLRRFEMPFGVFLGAAAIFSGFYGHGLIGWYMGLYR